MTDLLTWLTQNSKTGGQQYSYTSYKVSKYSQTLYAIISHQDFCLQTRPCFLLDWQLIPDAFIQTKVPMVAAVISLKTLRSFIRKKVVRRIS